MRPRTIRYFILSLAVIFTGAVVWLGWAGRKIIMVEPLPVLGEVADFSLLDTGMNEKSLEDLKGKTWVIDFMFTTCGTTCPVMTKQMAKLHRSYVLEEDVRLVSVSVNPEYDSPNILNDYAQKHEIDTDKWFFLTGSREAIHKLAVESFKVGSVDDPVFHSTRFILVDPQARIRGYYDRMEDEAIDKLFHDMARLLKESS